MPRNTQPQPVVHDEYETILSALDGEIIAQLERDVAAAAQQEQIQVQMIEPRMTATRIHEAHVAAEAQRRMYGNGYVNMPFIHMGVNDVPERPEPRQEGETVVYTPDGWHMPHVGRTTRAPRPRVEPEVEIQLPFCMGGTARSGAVEVLDDDIIPIGWSDVSNEFKDELESIRRDRNNPFARAIRKD